MGVKALSKSGHNCMPKGRSKLGSGSAFRISVALDDILEVAYGDSYVCSDRSRRCADELARFRCFRTRNDAEEGKIRRHVSARVKLKAKELRTNGSRIGRRLVEGVTRRGRQLKATWECGGGGERGCEKEKILIELTPWNRPRLPWLRCGSRNWLAEIGQNPTAARHVIGDEHTIMMIEPSEVSDAVEYIYGSVYLKSEVFLS